MFQLLQKNSSINLLLIPAIVLLLWGANLLHPEFIVHYYDATPMILYRPLMALQQWNGLVGQLALLLIMTINAVLLTRLNAAVSLIEKRSLFYIILFVVFSASLPDFRQMNPMQPALLCIILGLFSLFKMYKNERELKAVFEAGACFSLASLFYAPAIYFCAVLFLGLAILVSFYWRQWLSAAIGLSFPILLVFAIAFCFDALPGQISVWKENLLVPHKAISINLFPALFSVILAFIMILSVLYSYTNGLKKVSHRKYYLVLLLLLVAALVLAMAVPTVSLEILFFGLLPVALFAANYMVSIKKKLFAEILFVLIVVMTILTQLFPHVPIPQL